MPPDHNRNRTFLSHRYQAEEDHFDLMTFQSSIDSESNQDEVGPQAKLIDKALLKYYFVNISLLPRYCIYLYNIQK